MPTLHPHSFELFLLAGKACKAAIDDGHRPNALTTDSLVSVVMATAAAEAFLHELAFHVEVTRQNPAFASAVSAQLVACAAAIGELEDSKATVIAKYLIASLVLSGSSFERGEAPLQGFVQLVNVRSAIIHLKPATEGDSHVGAKNVAALAQRGITQPLFPGARESWFHRLMRPGVAVWACMSALEVIRAVLHLAPAPSFPQPDPLVALRQFDEAYLDRAT